MGGDLTIDCPPRRRFRRLGGLLVTLLAAGVTPACVSGTCVDGLGDDAIELILEANPLSPLSAVATVAVEAAASVAIELHSDVVGPHRTTASASAVSHTIDVVGMRASTTYQLRAVTLDGEALCSAEVAFETGPLPSGIPEYEVTGEPNGKGITIVGVGTMGGPPDDPGPYLFGVDGEGEVVWTLSDPDLDPAARNRSAELLDDGNLRILNRTGLRVMSRGGETLQILDLGDTYGAIHHDAAALPNGNFALLGRIVEQVDVPELGGLVSVQGDLIVEATTSGEVVWVWSTFDGLPLRFPTVLSTTLTQSGEAYDWTHANSLYYDETTDELVMSLRHQDQVVAIARGGDVSWILGPEGDFDLTSGSFSSGQHAATIIGHDPTEVLLYDNRNGTPELPSRAASFVIDEGAGTVAEGFSWEAAVATPNLGDADRLPDGNTLITVGGVRPEPEPVRVVEVTPDGEVVWELTVPGRKLVFRTTRTHWLTPVE